MMRIRAYILTSLFLVLACAMAAQVQAQPIEVDQFPFSRVVVQLINTPQGTITATLSGPATVEVDFATLGDGDNNNREEVETEIVAMDLTGISDAGLVIARVRDSALHPLQQSLGQIEEHDSDSMSFPGILELTGAPNFPGTGTADSFFNVFPEIELPDLGLTLHTHDPKFLQAILNEKPPGELDIYQGIDPIDLFTENDVLFGQLAFTQHTPTPEVDAFTLSRVAAQLINTPQGTIRSTLSGPLTVVVDFGTLGDEPANGLNEVTTEIVEMNLVGNSNAGQVIVMVRDFLVHPFERSLGEIEEQTNTDNTILELTGAPGYMGPAATATSFFNVFPEIVLPGLGLTLHTHDPKFLQAILNEKPPAPDDFYQGIVPIDLFTEDEMPFGQLAFTQHIPSCLDGIPPICAPIAGTNIDVRAQDLGSGLGAINVITQQNAVVSIPNFGFCTRDPAIVELRQTASPAFVTLEVCDCCNVCITCDPVITLVIRETGKPESETLTNIPQAESNVSCQNGDPGIKNLLIDVNGTRFRLAGLKDNETTTLDISSAMVAGDDNTITVTAFGKPGTSALLVISD